MRRIEDRPVVRHAVCGGLDRASESDFVRYDFQNDLVYAYLQLNFSDHTVWFNMDDRTSRNFIDSEGREDVPETPKER